VRRVSPPRLQSALAWVRRNGPGIALELGVNVALPYAIFSVVKPEFGDIGGLIAGAAPPLAWSVAGFVRVRRIDALSLVVLLGIALSLLAFAGGGGARLLQLRERLVTGVIGLVFLGSAAIGRPIIYQLARARLRRGAPDKLGVFDSLRESPIFRRAMMVMTLVWGVFLVADSALAALLVFALSIKAYLIVAPLIGYPLFAALTIWTFWYARRRVIAARNAAAADGARFVSD
jgi:uncharacterized membrane protein